MELIGQFRCNRLFLADAHQYWYHGAILGFSSGLESTVNEIRGIVKDNGIEKLVTIGTSMGGHASLLFGGLLGVQHIVAFSPQTNITSKFLSEIGDNRWAQKMEEINQIGFEHLNLSSMDLSAIDARLYYDGGDELDSHHAACLSGAPGVTITDVAGGGHSVAYEMAKRGEVSRILGEFLN